MRTTNALGTSCTSRQGAPQKVKVTAVAWPGWSQRAGGVLGVVELADVGRRDLDLFVEHRAGGRRGRRHHLVHRLADGGELELGELAARLDGVGVGAHHGRGQAARALDADDHDVAAGDAVDVGRRRPRSRAASRRRTATGPAATTLTEPGATPSGLNICRTPWTASAVEAPRRRRAWSAFMVPGSTGAVIWTARRVPLRPPRA